MSSTFSHLSESGKLFIKKTTPLTRAVIELFSMLRFSMKHGGSVLVTARQQTYCASNLQVLRKAKLRND